MMNELGPSSDLSDISKVFEVDDIFTRMCTITGLKGSHRTGLWLTKFKVQSAQYIATIGQSEIVPLNHPIEINTLWFQLVYDIEHLNSQSALIFDLNRLSTVASSVSG